MKKYCRNCKWGKGLEEYASYCRKPLIGDDVIDYFRHLPKKLLNKDGECKHYKRKWYLFLTRISK